MGLESYDVVRIVSGPDSSLGTMMVSEEGVTDKLLGKDKRQQRRGVTTTSPAGSCWHLGFSSFI